MHDFELALQDQRTLDDPYPLYKQMRADAPVYYCRRAGLWVVMRHADILELLTSAHASCAHRFGPVVEKGTAWLVDSDGQMHRRLRRVLGEGLGHDDPCVFSQQVEQVATELVCQLATRECFDAVADYAEPLALAMEAWLLTGDNCWPEDTLTHVRAWNQEFIRLTGEIANPMTLSEVRRMIMSGRAATALCRSFLLDHARLPAHALSSHLGRQIDAGNITIDHAAGLLTEMIFATSKNTINAISNGVLALCNAPEQRQVFLAKAEPAEFGVDELLRFGGAVQFTTRIIEHACVINGQQLNEHSRVLLYLGSANRDETVFHEPDQLDLGRTGHKALSFGHGAHHCLGANLARLEIGIALRTLFQHMPALRPVPDQTVQYARPAYRGLLRLMVSPGA